MPKNIQGKFELSKPEDTERILRLARPLTFVSVLDRYLQALPTQPKTKKAIQLRNAEDVFTGDNWTVWAQSQVNNLPDGQTLTARLTREWDASSVTLTARRLGLPKTQYDSIRDIDFFCLPNQIRWRLSDENKLELIAPGSKYRYSLAPSLARVEMEAVNVTRAEDALFSAARAIAGFTYEAEFIPLGPNADVIPADFIASTPGLLS